VATQRRTEPVPTRAVARRSGRSAALLLALVLAGGGAFAYLSASRTGKSAPQTAVGAVAWPFQGTAAVAALHQKEVTSSFDAMAGGFAAEARASGRIGVHVGQPHALFAANYRPRALAVVVAVAPVTGDGQVTGLAGLFAADNRHHGTDAFMPLLAGEQQISGNVHSYFRLDEDDVTVVVGGPRAGGLLVQVDGQREAVAQLDGAQTQFDSRGVAWMYSFVPATSAQPTNGVMTVTDGNGNLENVLYYGRPSAVSTSG
jgi:hypothetical protein